MRLFLSLSLALLLTACALQVAPAPESTRAPALEHGATHAPALTPTSAAYLPIVQNPGGSWAAGLSLTNTAYVTVNTTSYASSANLLASWQPFTSTVHHYRLALSNGVDIVQAEIPGVQTSVVLTNLPSSTLHTASLTACLDAACAQAFGANTFASARTAAEYWQIVGTGNTYTTALRLVSDGNTKPYAIRYDAWAGPTLTNRLQLYYDPLMNDKGIKLGQLAASQVTTLSSVTLFNPIAGYGLRSPCVPPPPGTPTPPACTTPAASARSVNTFQAVPLLNPARLRLFFEAQGTDGQTRLMTLDSQDGYVGYDFHAGTPTRCETLSDFAAGGGCTPTVILGVQGDAQHANPNVTAVRQSKMGYPTLNDWRWDGAVGTFMFVTIDVPQSCNPYFMTSGYAVWDGTQWALQYGANNCPRTFSAVQAPLPMHLGGARYKLYFSNNTSLQGQPGNNDNKPLKVMYADGGRSGDPNVVDFADWDGTVLAREVHFLWPDGSLLNLVSESHLDDFAFLTPNQNLEFQVMYTNMSNAGGGGPPFIGSAVLVNP